MLLLDVTAVLHPSEMAFFGTNSVHNLAFSSSHTSEASNHLMQILATIWPSHPPTGVPGSFVRILYDIENVEEEQILLIVDN